MMKLTTGYRLKACMSEVVRLIKVYKEVDRGMSGSVVSGIRLQPGVRFLAKVEGFLMVV